MKHKNVHLLQFSLVFLLLVLLASACGTETSTPTAAAIAPTTITATTTSASPTAEAPASTSAPPAPETTSAPAGDSGGGTAGDIAAAVASRTPAPTPTPGIIDREIDDLTTSLGLSGRTFLGLTTDDWFSLVFSVLLVVAGYFLGFKLLVWILNWIANRTSRKLNKFLLKELEPDLKLLLLVFFTRFAILRLEFLSDGFRSIADDIFFIIEIVLISIIAIRSLNFSLDRYVMSTHKKDDQDNLAPLTKTVQRLGDFIVVLLAGSIGISHFGIGGSTLAAALIIIGVILYLGAKGIVSDFVAGFIILVDRPFRVKDAILIKELDTWGVVLEIGTRTTRIRTGDNREVIIPNSQINESQLINYTYPDPSFRVTTDIGVAYGSDFDQMREVIKDTVSGVEGVLADKPVDIFFMKYGDSARQVHVRWWIGSYINENPILDKVNQALEVALDKAGIDMPFDTYDLNVKMEDEKTNQVVKDTKTEDGNANQSGHKQMKKG
jgi:small-conductance mechanosensitive channel